MSLPAIIRNSFTKQRNQRAFGLIEILLVAVIIAVLFSFMMKSYLQPKPRLADEEILQQEGINTTSYRSVVDSAREKVKNASEMLMEHERKMEEWKPE